jgi:hypothetical protein
MGSRPPEQESQQPSHATPIVSASVPMVQGQGHPPVPVALSLTGIPSGRGRTAFVTAMVGLLMVLALILWRWWANDPVAAHYKTLPIERGPITSLVTATGAVNPVISVQVGSQVSGKIAKLYADFNSIVREGQVLASIDQKPYQAKVSQAKAALKSATATPRQSPESCSRREDSNSIADGCVAGATIRRPVGSGSVENQSIAMPKHRWTCLRRRSTKPRPRSSSAELDLGLHHHYFAGQRHRRLP